MYITVLQEDFKIWCHQCTNEQMYSFSPEDYPLLSMVEVKKELENANDVN